MPDERPYYTVAEAAHLLDVHPSTVWRWIASHRLGAYRVGPRTLRIRREDLEGCRRTVKQDAIQNAPKRYVPRNLSAEDLVRRAAAIDRLLEHRTNIAPLTTSDLIAEIRREQERRDAGR